MPEAITKPILIFVDSQGSIKMAKNDVSGTRTKLIDIRYHFESDLLFRNHYTTEYIPTSSMIAYILTKTL